MKLVPVILALQVLGVYRPPILQPVLGADVFKLNKEVQPCMMNCGQCKEMYGEYFDGRRCAEFCLVRDAASPMPDCNAPDTVGRFLKGVDYGQPLNWAALQQNLPKSPAGSGHATDMWKRFNSFRPYRGFTNARYTYP